MKSICENGLGISCDDGTEETESSESSESRRLWRGRRFSLGMERSARNLSFSLHLSASDVDLVGMGLQYLPVTPRKSDATKAEASSGSKEVKRVLKVRLGDLRTIKGSGGRTATFFSVLLWLIGTTAVAALAAVVVPRIIERARLGPATERAAVFHQAASWEATAPAQKPFIGALFDPQVMQGCVDAASQMVDTLRIQVSPIAASKECLKLNAVPDLPVAAVGLASAIASVLTTQPSESAQASIIEPGPNASPATHTEKYGSFDIDQAMLSARLCGAAYFSCDEPDRWASTERLEAEVQGAGLALVQEVFGIKDEYAFIAKQSGRISVVFRGSCTFNNVLTDVDMVRGAAATPAERLQEATGMIMPKDLVLHHGFVEAYLNIREELLHTIRLLVQQGSKPLEVHITGHSMGGAVAMLAAMEINHLRKHGEMHVQTPQTFTFAAPRLGDAAFADLFTRAFPEPDKFWAVQAPSDAVPHLPFSAWGFRHPEGVLKLDGSMVCPQATRRMTDPGDSLELLRPKHGDVSQWAFCHDLEEYIRLLKAIA